MDIVFFSTFRRMKWDEKNMNLVRFSEKQNDVNGKVMMPFTKKGVTIYSTLMVVNVDSTYNTILGGLW